MALRAILRHPHQNMRGLINTLLALSQFKANDYGPAYHLRPVRTEPEARACEGFVEVAASDVPTTALASDLLYSTSTTKIGTLLKDPSSTRLLDKHFPWHRCDKRIAWARG